MSGSFEPCVVTGARGPSGPYSAVLRADNLIFVAGHGPFDVAGAIFGDDIATQTRQTIANVQACLRAAGAELSDVVRIDAYLADLDDCDGFNAEYARHFEEPRPVRTTVQAGLNGHLVALAAIAMRSGR